MKKILLASTLFTALVGLVLTGCLKDKGFNNHTYGINDPDTQPAGVGFPLGAKPKNSVGLDVSATTQVVNDIVYVNLESGKPAPSDIQVTLILNSALITAYNTANNTSIQILSPIVYNLPSLTITIPAGKTNAQIPINVLSTSTLDPNLSYGIGLTISAVTGNLKIADNLKNLLVVFNIKNKYDGKYTMKGQFYHPSNDPAFSHHVFTVELQTSGPSSLRLYWPLVGDYNIPLTVNGQPACCFAAQELSFLINTTTNAATAMNTAVGGTVVYSPILTYTDNNNVTHTYNNRYDPATKTIYAAFGYSLGPGGTVLPGASRAWIDTLVYTGPR